MIAIFTAVARALRDVVQPRILAVLVLPMLGAVLLWAVLAFFFWDAWTGGFRMLVEGTGIARWLVERSAAWVIEGTGMIVVVVLLVPATLVTAMLATELVAMPVIVSVAGRRHPTLEKRAGGTVAGGVTNAGFAVAAFVLLWLVTLPLWLTGVGVAVVALNSAWLNQRLFRYDALSEHASPEEFGEIVRRERLRLFGLGLVLAPLYYVPLVNLAAPVLSGLAFAHYCLSALAALRRSDEQEVTKKGDEKRLGRWSER